MVVLPFQQVYVVFFGAPNIQPRNCITSLHFLVNEKPEKKKKKVLQHNQMNFLCSNYKYMYRRGGDVWT